MSGFRQTITRGDGDSRLFWSEAGAATSLAAYAQVNQLLLENGFDDFAEVQPAVGWAVVDTHIVGCQLRLRFPIAMRTL
jgi:hypothetical protein